MDTDRFFGSLRCEEMPDGLEARVVRACSSCRKRTTRPVRKTALIAAILTLLTAATAVCTVQQGFFRDIRSLFGAVTGTEYMQATEEIRVTASRAAGGIRLDVAFERPEKAPYAFSEQICVGRYRITDEDGNTLITGTGSDPVPLSDAKAALYIPLAEIPSGAHSVSIDSFICEKKADQPLEIHGTWICPLA